MAFRTGPVPSAIASIPGVTEKYAHLVEGEDDWGGTVSLSVQIFNGSSGTIVRGHFDCNGRFNYRARDQWFDAAPPKRLEPGKEALCVAVETGIMTGVEGLFAYKDGSTGNDIAEVKFSIPWTWKKNTFQTNAANGYWVGWIDGTTNGCRLQRTLLICDGARARVWEKLSAFRSGQQAIPLDPEEWDKAEGGGKESFADLIMQMARDANERLFDPEAELYSVWQTVLAKRRDSKQG